MELNIEKIECCVVNEAVETLVAKYSKYGDESLAEEIERKAVSIIRELIESQIAGVVAAGLESLTFPVTNGFGETKASPLTLREFIAKQVNDYLQEKVDSRGRTDGYDKVPRIRWLLTQELSKQIDSSVKAAAVGIREQISACIGDIVKANIDEAVRKLRW